MFPKNTTEWVVFLLAIAAGYYISTHWLTTGMAA